MAGAIAYGFANGEFGNNASAIWALPWGKVSLIDLYAGLALFGGWIWLRETSRTRTILWWVALAVLGNLAAGAYLAVALLRAETTEQVLTGERSGAG